MLRALGLRPGPGQTAEDLAAVLLDDIPKAPYPNEMQTLAGAARALSPRLPPDKVRAATAAVLGALVATDDPFALRSATLALRALPVPAATRRDPGVVGPVLYGLEHAADPDAATALAQALQALAPDLDDDQAKAALAAVLAALGRASDPKAVDALAEAAGALPLPPESGQAAVLGPVLDAVGRACPCALPTVAGALRALAPKLGPATARPALDAVLAAAGRGVDAETADALAQAARALRVRPDPERTRTVLGALAGAGDLGTFQSAAWTVRVLAPVLAFRRAGWGGRSVPSSPPSTAPATRGR